MNPIRIIRRLAGILAGMTAALVACTAAAPAPAAFAIRVPPPGGYSGRQQVPPVVHTITVGGMPGWQIALIAAAAAVVAAVLAVLLDRTWAARRREIAGTA